MSPRSTRPSRRFAHRRGRRSSGAWSAVPVVERESTVAERAPEERYTEACAVCREHLNAGRAAPAVEAAREALAALPRGLEAQRLLGLALLEQGEARPASHAFSAALTGDPLDLVSLVGLAEAQERMEDVGAAESAWQRAWEADPGATGVGERLQAARRAAGVLDVQPGPPPLTRAALARIHLRGGLHEHAAVEARAVLARDGESPQTQLTLAEAFWRAGDAASAAAAANDILEKSQDCVAANLLVAAHWASEGRDASELLARVRLIDPAGTIASRLFDDREVPALFGSDQPDRWGALTTSVASSTLSTPTDQVAFADSIETTPELEVDGVEETRELPVLAAALEPELDAELDIEPDEEPKLEPEAAELPVDPEVIMEPSAEPLAEVPSVDLPAEEQVEPEAEDQPVLDSMQETVAAEPVEGGPPPDEPVRDEPLPDGLTREGSTLDESLPVASQPVARDSDGRGAGDEAMRTGQYREAVRLYGEWLRSVRQARGR